MSTKCPVKHAAAALNAWDREMLRQLLVLSDTPRHVFLSWIRGKWAGRSHRDAYAAYVSYWRPPESGLLEVHAVSSSMIIRR